METNKLVAIFIPILAIVVFTIVNSFVNKSELSKKQKQASFAVAVTGIVLMIVVAFIII